MGWKDWAAAINPTALFANAVALGGDYLAGQQAGEEASDARRHQDQVNIANAELQREFAKNSIRWRIEDAASVGLSPLAAIGASSYNASPSHVASGPDHTKSEMYSRMGQNISRAVQSTMTQDERVMSRLSVERANLENELLRTQILAIKAPSNPPLPSYNTQFGYGGAPSGDVVTGVYDSRNRPPHPHKRSQVYGYKPDVEFTHTAKGLGPVIPEALSESYESDPIGAAMWRWRNSILPNFGDMGTMPPVSDLPRGYTTWRYSRMRQEWVPAGYKHDLREGYDYRRYK